MYTVVCMEFSRLTSQVETFNRRNFNFSVCLNEDQRQNITAQTYHENVANDIVYNYV